MRSPRTPPLLERERIILGSRGCQRVAVGRHADCMIVTIMLRSQIKSQQVLGFSGLKTAIFLDLFGASRDFFRLLNVT